MLTTVVQVIFVGIALYLPITDLFNVLLSLFRLFGFGCRNLIKQAYLVLEYCIETSVQKFCMLQFQHTHKITILTYKTMSSLIKQNQFINHNNKMNPNKFKGTTTSNILLSATPEETSLYLLYLSSKSSASTPYNWL